MEGIGQKKIILGILPIGLSTWQQAYYDLKGLHKCGRSWSRKLASHLVETSHQLWILRCNIIHTREIGGLYIEDEILLQKEVKNQWTLGIEDLAVIDSNLFRKTCTDTLQKPLDWIRGWLVQEGILYKLKMNGRKIDMSSNINEVSLTKMICW